MIKNDIMAIEKFSTLISTCVPLPIENVDTDQIIPARFLKAVTRSGFGENLFRDWRYDKNGKPREDFVLNNDRFRGEILVTGKNFGSGSSREHAAWAIRDYGFRVVISSYFADIFRSNSLNNGLLTIQVSESFLAQLLEMVESEPSLKLRADLENQKISVLPDGPEEEFEINAYKKNCLLNGYDDIDYLLSIKERIGEWEKNNSYERN